MPCVHTVRSLHAVGAHACVAALLQTLQGDFHWRHLVGLFGQRAAACRPYKEDTQDEHLLKYTEKQCGCCARHDVLCCGALSDSHKRAAQDKYKGIDMPVVTNKTHAVSTVRPTNNTLRG